MSRIAVLLAAITLATGAARAEYREFKDWVVGCDNLRSCTALGLTPVDDGRPIYVRITRDGAADAEASAELVVYTEEQTTIVFFTIDGTRTQLKVETNDGLARAELPADMLARIANATEMRVATVVAGGNRVNDPVAISAEGASASLRFMDAAQKRDGGVTALVAKGDRPASAIPAVPALPEIVPVMMTELLELPPVPAGLGEADEFCNESMRHIAHGLSERKTLWGVCVSSGAYNFTYDFSIEEGGKLTPARFIVPGTDSPADTEGTLTNPYLDAGGQILYAGSKGRGIGDCGEMSEWAWDGVAMQPLSYRLLGHCRGISSDEWPVLYRAQVKN